MKLRILDYLDDIQEFNGVAISSKLRCTCGNCSFVFLHTGKQTKGILAPYIVKKNKQLAIKARCTKCNNDIIVFDSQIDGSNPKIAEQLNEFTTFTTPRFFEFEVVIKYNYWPENFKEDGNYSNSFENCFIYIIENNKEGKALIEEFSCRR